MYPNPANNSLQVSFSGNRETAEIQISDMLGNIVKETRVKSQEARTEIDITDLKEGVYNISISTKADGVVNKKVVVVR